METPSTQLPEIKLPNISPTLGVLPSPELTGAVAPIQMGSDIKPFPSFDFMFSNQQSKK